VTIGLLFLNSAPLEEALEQVQGARPEIILNEGQVAWLRSWESVGE
jgi:hypothetical protein